MRRESAALLISLTAPSPRLSLALLAAAATALAACSDDSGDPPPPGGASGFDSNYGGVGGNSPFAGREGGSPPERPGADGAVSDHPASVDVDPSIFGCPEVPTAYVLEFQDPHTNSPGEGAALLAQAGFDVQPLPLDRDPRELRGLIFLGSFVSENPAYRDYLARNSTALYTFVDAANVLIEMTQADMTERSPPFLPNAQNAQRSDDDVPKLLVRDREHPLMKGVPVADDGSLVWQFPNLGWETFADWRGFKVLLAKTSNGRNPALMEGPYAQGRFLLSAVPADKPLGAGPDRDQFNRAFFANLYQYVRDVCRRQAREVIVTPPPGRGSLDKSAFTIAVLPDTQYYSQGWPGIFLAQTSWIVANAQRLNIPYVLHLGDIVDLNSPIEWQRASEAMWLLEGIVPYALVTGNHDLGPNGSAGTRDTLLNDYFSYASTAAWPSFGGAYQEGRLDNTYHLFSAGGRDYIVIALEWGPRDVVVEWANGVMASHPRRYGILITHAYLNNNDRRYDHNDKVNPQAFNPWDYGTPGGVNDGEELWQKLVRKYAFVMVLNGHVLGDGTGYLASVTDKGNTCHQMLSNYQFRQPTGGDGYLRLLQFLEDGRTVNVHTYSPLFDRFLDTPDQDFSFMLDVPVGPAP
jgi:3',5'-cyclic AMP phosphodiesterase CpdA